MTPPTDSFTDAEAEAFHATDRRAATAIVAIVVNIFLFGVGLYVAIAYFAGR